MHTRRKERTFRMFTCTRVCIECCLYLRTSVRRQTPIRGDGPNAAECRERTARRKKCGTCRPTLSSPPSRSVERLHLYVCVRVYVWRYVSMCTHVCICMCMHDVHVSSLWMNVCIHDGMIVGAQVHDYCMRQYIHPECIRTYVHTYIHSTDTASTHEPTWIMQLGQHVALKDLEDVNMRVELPGTGVGRRAFERHGKNWTDGK